MKTSPVVLPLLGSIALLLAPAPGAEISKIQNTTALNLAGAWSGGVVPGTGDVMLWDSLYTTPGAAATLSQLGADLSVLGLKVTNVGGAANAATTMVGFQNTGSANTLTIGAGGIDLAAATQALMISSKVLIGANQNWVVANANTSGNPQAFNNGEDLAFQALAAGAAFNLGAKTVTVSGAGHITVSSGYTMSNGTINIGNVLFLIGGGGSRLTTVNADVNLNVAGGSVLQFQCNSGAVTSAANIGLNGGTLRLVSNTAGTAVTLTGTTTVNSASTINVGNTYANGSVVSTGGILFNANLAGSAALALTNTASTASLLLLGGNNSGYLGTVTLSGTAGRVFRLTTATAGSSAATWSVGTGITLQTGGVAVNLGTLNGAGTISNSAGAGTISVGAGTFTGSLLDGTGTLALTKTGSGTLTLSGVSSNTGATTVSGGTLLVAPGTLSGTAVTVSSGATYAAQAAAAGALNTPVNLAGGGTMLVRPLAAGGSVALPALSSAGTGTITFDTGVLGNPTVAPLSLTSFSASAGAKLRFIGSNLSAGTFPAISYTGAIGGGGFAGLTLALPFRITGGLVNAAGAVNVNITGTAKPAWRGNVDGNWNIDAVGDGSTGTPNWLASTGPNTYVEAAVGTDSVIFDDTATGGTNVNLATTLSPNGVAVANSALTYTFGGSGRITGAGALTKTGNGALTMANTGTNDFSGGVFLSDGTIKLGDSVTSGAGTLGTGTVTVNAPGTLELNRPDAFTLANVVTGSGGLKKSQASTATLSAATTLAGSVNLAAGKLRFTAGGTLSGDISGAGFLEAAGGTLLLSGGTANTNTSLTTVTAGVLQLGKTAGVSAVGGDITISGAGSVTLSASEQIPDSATITLLGTSGSAVLAQAGNTETVANVIVSSSVGGAAGGQVIMGTNGSFFTITNTATVNSGILGVASNGTGTAGTVLLTSANAILRIAGNGGPSTLNVGAGGITASAGSTIQVGQGTGAFDAVLNLGGDFTTTGSVAITDGGFLGGNLRQINLAATRTFNIAAGTTTTVAPDLAGTGGITKTGNGTLQLLATSAGTYSGPTTVSAGTFLTTPAQTGSGSVSVAGGATFGVTIPFAGSTFLASDTTTAATSTLVLATAGLGNPIAPLISAGNFTVDGATTLRLTGTALASGTGIPLISYSALGGVAGFGGLSIVLPTRLAGTLVNNLVDSRVDLDLMVEQAKWNGNVNGNWDIDPDGTGATGTNNWLTTVAGGTTRYFQGPPINTDTANFDDSATGTTTVNLTTALTPVAVNVNNSALTYTFAGSGRLTGATSLTKNGNGILVLANSLAYNHTAGTTINGGTLQVGDGVTPALGALPTVAVTNNATIRLNRPDDFAIATAINGNGTIVKAQANTATFTLATNYAGPWQLNAGTLLFSAGGNLSGALSGPGALGVSGGTLQLSGGDANTNTGLTTVSAGTLQLNKFSGVHAVGGNLLFTGTGLLTLSQPEEIPDTATITYDKNGTNLGNILIGNETFAALTIINGNDTGSQVQGLNGFVVTGLLTAQNTSVFAIASNNSGSVGGLNLSGSAVIRVSANSNPTTLTVGALGITASGGTVQVGQGTGAFDAVLNLGGDVTATGSFAFTDGGFTGANLRQIHLGAATRTFTVATGANILLAPDLAGPGGLTKAGNGNLQLTTASFGTFTGGTTISGGTLSIASGNALDDAGPVTLANAAGVLLLMNASETIGSLSGGGALGGEVSLNSNTLTVGDATSTTFSGTISGPGGTVHKVGAGALTLDGLQSYGTLTTDTGTTNVNSALGTGSSMVNALGGATFFGVGQNLAALTIGDGATVTFGTGPEAAPLALAAAAVPEPGALGLLTLSTLALGFRRRTRKG